MGIVRLLRDLLHRFRRRKARRRAVQEFRRSLVLIVDPQALVASVTNRLKELFDPDRILICELNPRGDHFRITFSSPALPVNEDADGDSSDGAAPLAADGRLARWLRVNETYLSLHHQQDVVEYLTREERAWLERTGCQLCAPMMAKNQLIGLVLLGFDRSSSMIRKSDAALLLQLAEQASLAFQNAALYREQQERLVRLHRADRLAAMGQLAAGVAHEVRNPLTAIRSTMQYLGTTVEGSRRELFEDLIGEVDRIDHIISGLLNLARTGNLQRLPVDLSELTDQTVRFLDHRARKQNAKISAQSSEPIMVEADPNQLRQVFLNLILNALQAMPDGGSIVVDSQIEPNRARPSQGWAQIRIIDDGPGIPEEVLRNVLDPFFTTKSEGTGLGLPICHNIIEQHGGKLDIQSEVGEGTTVLIQLPLSNEAPLPTEADLAAPSE